MAFPGSKIQGHLRNDRVEGLGRYEFPDGNVYVGQFKDGSFHGRGIIFFPNGKYIAEWERGKEIRGQFIFDDGLEYSEKDWDYCHGNNHLLYKESDGDFLITKQEL